MGVSILTGESLPVSRFIEPVAENMHASDATNLVFAGSTVAPGRGVAVVYATGTHTEFAQVAHLTANDELASLGYRVLGVATHQGRNKLLKQNNEFLEQNLT